MEKLYIVTILTLFLSLFANVNPTFSVPEGLYRINITIDNTLSSVDLLDYQILLELNTKALVQQGKMRRDCGDIRFVDEDMETSLNYYVWSKNTNYLGLSYSFDEFGCGSERTLIRVRVPFIRAGSFKKIYLYYGNMSLTYNSSILNIYTDTAVLLPITLPYAVYGLSCVPYKDSVYCYGDNYRSNRILYFNVTNKSTSILNIYLPYGVWYPSCVPYKDSVYCFGGQSQIGGYLTALDIIVKHNITNNSIQIVNARMPKGLFGLSCAPYKDSVYCFGGTIGVNMDNTIFKYNITSDTTYLLNTSLPYGIVFLSCVPYKDFIYCFGGYYQVDGGFGALGRIYKFNIKNETIEDVGYMPLRFPARCAPFEDMVVCFDDTENIYIYNISSGVVVKSTATTYRKDGQSCVLVGDAIYCLGGYQSNTIVRYGLKFIDPEPKVYLSEEETLFFIPSVEIPTSIYALLELLLSPLMILIIFSAGIGYYVESRAKTGGHAFLFVFTALLLAFSIFTEFIPRWIILLVITIFIGGMILLRR